MTQQEKVQQIVHHLQQGDHDWFEVEAMRNARDAHWHQLVGKSIESCALNIEGTVRQYIPLYLPMIVHTKAEIDYLLDPHYVGEVLGPHIPAGYALVVFPNLKSLNETIQLDPVTAYGLSKEMAVSIYEKDGLEGILPFDPEVDAHQVEGTTVLEGMLLACLVKEGAHEVPAVRIPVAVLGELANGLAAQIALHSNGAPMVHIGTAATRSTLIDNTMMVQTFCHLKLLASKGYTNIELEFTHSDPAGRYLNYVAREARTKGVVGEIKLPEQRIEEFVRHCDYLALHAKIQCRFCASHLN